MSRTSLIYSYTSGMYGCNVRPLWHHHRQANITDTAYFREPGSNQTMNYSISRTSNFSQNFAPRSTTGEKRKKGVHKLLARQHPALSRKAAGRHRQPDPNHYGHRAIRAKRRIAQHSITIAQRC